LRCFLAQRFIRVLSTGLGSGYCPFAPGTAGTLVGIPVYLVFSTFPWPVLLLSVTALSFLAVYVSGEAERVFGEKDPPAVVIDEIAGLQVALFLVPPSFFSVAAGFVLFRFFDVLKPFPVRACERLPGGWGVVADDLAAGLYSVLVLQLLIRVL
jgi:phosphatidylglycerophosphatase A